MIKRDEYLKKLIGFRDRQLIKVITGIRRCGKSTLLEIYRQHLLSAGVSDGRIISINFEDMDNDHLRQPRELHDHIVSRLDRDAMNYVFLDEVQAVEDFPRVVDSLFIKKNVDVYITGSNAYMLSEEIATLLSGRYVELSMLPLSFAEYVSSFGDRTDLSRRYSDYLRYSSFPYAVRLGADARMTKDYLGGIYNTVLLKDVVARKKISDVMTLESVIRFMADGVGNLLSTKKIADTLTSSGRKISTHTVESYLSALTDSFVFYRARRYDIKGKQFLKTNEKYYIVDPGLRYYLLGSRGPDVGRMLENVVYLELLRRGYGVYVGKLNGLEVDFVVTRGDVTEYYQVALTVRDRDTLERELLPLRKIADHNPKYVLTLDEDPPASHNGIR
ncbi:MAG: ATP-binding protein, partial [Synergistaceae bacterium]|nr:ATP-binding protein [Synergistaceae bacterium]